MKIVKIRQIAQQKGIKSGKMKKADLIRAIQNQEGNSICFESAVNPLTAMDPCDLSACSWRSDCVID